MYKTNKLYRMSTASLPNIIETEIKALVKGGYFNSKDSFIEEAIKYMLSNRGDLKINAAVEMFPLSWPEFENLHPFVPQDQAAGYYQLLNELEEDLKTITGFDAVSFQPNSGAAGEYTGLTVIKAWHKSRGEDQRDIVLIPASAHGTNPASAVMAGMNVIVVNCDEQGNIDLEDLRNKAVDNKNKLAAFMVTYPSTHGVFEEDIKEMIELVHEKHFNTATCSFGDMNKNAVEGLTDHIS